MGTTGVGFHHPRLPQPDSGFPEYSVTLLPRRSCPFHSTFISFQAQRLPQARNPVAPCEHLVISI